MARTRKAEASEGKAADTGVNAFVGKDELLKFYQDMLLIRRFEERAGQLYGMGLIGGFCHLYIGQEAVVVGLMGAAKQGDQQVTSYRDHGHMLAQGLDPKAVMAELTGRSTGLSRGKGGSMHMFSRERNFFGGHGIVGTPSSLGIGLAFAQRYKARFNQDVELYAPFSYEYGLHPPHQRDPKLCARVLEHLAQGHLLAYREIKKIDPEAMVGIAHSATWTVFSDPKRQAAEEETYYRFIDRIMPHLDFIGLNNYMVHGDREGVEYQAWMGGDPTVSPGMTVKSDFGWAMCPKSAYGVLKKFANRYKDMPLMITEHGCSDASLDDHRRCWFIFETLRWLRIAILEGVPLLGYIHWAHLDNFEWAEGFTQRFGLVHVDFETQVRTPRHSLSLLSDFAQGATFEEVERKHASILQHPLLVAA